MWETRPEDWYLGAMEEVGRMQSKFYISAVGHEDMIRALHVELNIPGAEVKELRPNPIDPHPQAERWLWRSPYQVCSGDFPEDELAAYLRENGHVLSVLKQHSAHLRDVGPVIVSLPDQGRAGGYSVSSELIQLLASANASLEIDILESPRNDSAESAPGSN